MKSRLIVPCLALCALPALAAADIVHVTLPPVVVHSEGGVTNSVSLDLDGAGSASDIVFAHTSS